MDLALSREDEDFRTEVRRFLDENLTEDLREEPGARPPACSPTMRPGCAGTGSWPVAAGRRRAGRRNMAAPAGAQRSATSSAASASPPTRPRIFSMGLRMVGPVIMKFGTPEQKDKYLPRIVAATSPSARAIPSRARDRISRASRPPPERDGDDYVINAPRSGRPARTSPTTCSAWCGPRARASRRTASPSC